MKDKPVRTWMTPAPISISPNMSLPEAQQIMMENNIRRLPVVWQEKVVGILTYGDIREAKPSDANTLSVYELNLLLDHLRVKAIMTPDPITISPEATIGEAAQMLLRYKFGALPVVENERLVGIITETDFCRIILNASNTSMIENLSPTSIPIKDWMTPNPLTVHPQNTLPQVRKILIEHQIRRLPVIEDEELVGIVTLGDIREAQPSDVSTLRTYESESLAELITVDTVMTANPVTLQPESSIADAAQLMLEYKVGGLPIVNNGRLVGIITETDLCCLLTHI